MSTFQHSLDKRVQDQILCQLGKMQSRSVNTLSSQIYQKSVCKYVYLTVWICVLVNIALLAREYVLYVSVSPHRDRETNVSAMLLCRLMTDSTKNNRSNRNSCSIRKLEVNQKKSHVINL